jgi:polysaccharide deacetylase family protein (PEP-CTERM system associated)
MTLRNAMSVDVEDYFQVSAFERYVPRDEWDSRDCRVERNVERILEMFDQHSAKATFFTLGWIAKRYPSLVRKIVESGHELASHGWSHVRVTQQKPGEFREDVIRTKGLLEDTVGSPVIGYRAASYSIGETNLWALDVLRETGHRYSSSIFPIKHDLYGMPDAPRFGFRPAEDEFFEFPVTTVELAGRNLPCAGGGWFRLLPYNAVRWALRRVNTRDGEAAIFYFHPWEIDPGQPRQPGLDSKTRFRHYLNLGRMQARLLRLLEDFEWGRLDQTLYFPAIERDPGRSQQPVG